MAPSIIRKTTTLGVLSSLLLGFTSPSVLATNGYFSHGITTSERAMGGAGVANPSGPMAQEVNPANIADLDDGYEVMLSAFSPDRSYSATGGPAAPAGTPCGVACPFTIGGGSQNLDSKGTLFFIPSFAMARRISDNSAWGFAFIARGGMNTEWEGGTAILGTPSGSNAELPGTFGAGKTFSDLKQIALKGSYALQVNDSFDVGVSLVFHYQTFEAEGLSNFAPFSLDPTNLSNKGSDSSNGFGLQLGASWHVSDSISLAASYQPKTDMSEFDSYSGLFANDGDFDLPENYTLGIRAKTTHYRFLFDIQQINYSGVESLGNGISQLTTVCLSGDTSGCLGGSNGAGFGWEDMTIYKYGMERSLSNGHNIQVGYSYGEHPIPETEVVFNILAPAVIEQHFTAGYTMLNSDNKGWEFSFMYAPSKSVSGSNPFDPTQTVKLEMSQWEFSFGYQF
ncbi:MAG: outer membrane protein transport protein [Agarilytica sp.]